MNKVCVQFGCGFSNPNGWFNYDSSPTLRIQHNLLLRFLLKPLLKVKFPNNVIYGDVLKSLPHKDNSVDLVYCSHVLEHLTLEEFNDALIEVYRILKPGGVFRLVMPDLEMMIKAYNSNLEDSLAGIRFIKSTLMGVEKKRNKSIRGVAENTFGNSHHLWLWDFKSTEYYLQNSGFGKVRRATFLDSGIEEFSAVEDETRFEGSLGVQCIKPH